MRGMCLMSSSKGSVETWLEIVLHEINSSNGISKFIFDPHSTHKPLSTPKGRYRPFWLRLLKRGDEGEFLRENVEERVSGPEGMGSSVK
ncbi:hypothetical protein T06_337 [Trichinella sp. T6]|nr:hypothetical protein T06_337 [Trichinella sp. T6]